MQSEGGTVGKEGREMGDSEEEEPTKMKYVSKCHTETYWKLVLLNIKCHVSTYFPMFIHCQYFIDIIIISPFPYKLTLKFTN